MIWQGLGLSLMGMGLTFAALGLLILVMVLLQRLFSAPQPASAGPELDETLVISTLVQTTEEKEIVAAIAVALAHLCPLGIGGRELGAALETQPGRWWMMGRLQRQQADSAAQMHSRRRR
ncbi:MAG: OadG family protein [Anaerolineae bacterium]